MTKRMTLSARWKEKKRAQLASASDNEQTTPTSSRLQVILDNYLTRCSEESHLSHLFSLESRNIRESCLIDVLIVSSDLKDALEGLSEGERYNVVLQGMLRSKGGAGTSRLEEEAWPLLEEMGGGWFLDRISSCISQHNNDNRRRRRRATLFIEKCFGCRDSFFARGCGGVQRRCFCDGPLDAGGSRELVISRVEQRGGNRCCQLSLNVNLNQRFSINYPINLFINLSNQPTKLPIN
jgi:hypothetical protein